MLLIFLVERGLSSGHCCDGLFGHSIGAIDWSSYVSNIKNQGSSPYCWAYSSASFLEIKFAQLNEIYYQLSPIQIAEHANNERYSNMGCPVYTTNAPRGGYPRCALAYTRARGIMSDDDYLYYGYDIRKVIPIGVSHIMTYELPSFTAFYAALNQTPLVITINTAQLTYNANTIVIPTEPNDHAVVVTNICQKDQTLFLEFVNSYGVFWGNCGGYGYVRITNNSNVVNNHGVFNEVVTADLSNLMTILSESCTVQINAIYKSIWSIIFACTGLFALMVAVMVGMKSPNAIHL